MKETLKELALKQGATAVGVATADRLGAKPSMDPNYLLPGTKSVLSIMVAFDSEIIRRYLSKEDHRGMQRHETELYKKLARISTALADRIERAGYRAIACDTNLDYRFKTDSDYGKVPPALRLRLADWFAAPSPRFVQWLKRRLTPLAYAQGLGGIDWNLTPSFSHRYGAVAAGIGALGWSGNVLHPEYGAQVLYNSVLTDLPLEPDPMMQESSCDGCRICAGVCQSEYIARKSETAIRIGGRNFIHNEKRHNLRCVFVCGGFSGQNKHRQWSTWSPGRVPLPESDKALLGFWKNFVLNNLWRENYAAKILSDLTFHTQYGHVNKPHDRFDITCGNCQFVCAPTRAQRQKNLALLRSSGVVTEPPSYLSVSKHAADYRRQRFP